MSGARKGLVAPQNTFLDKIIRRCNAQGTSFVLSNARIVEYPIVYCNEKFSKLIGYSRVEILQKSSNFSFLYSEQTTTTMREQIQKSLDKQIFDQVEVHLVRKNKNPLWLVIYIAPVKNDKDEVVLFLITFRDITFLKSPIEEEDISKPGFSKFAKLARSVTKNKMITQTLLQNDSLYNLQNESSFLRVQSQEGYSGVSMSTLDGAEQGNGQGQTSSLLFRGPDQLKSDLERGAFSWQDAVPQYKQEAPKTPPHIILHYVPFKTAWDWIILILTAYTAIMVPLNTTFRGKNSIDDLGFLVVDSIVDVIFFIDIVLNFHTTFVGPKGEVISDARIIRINYFKGWFVVDLLSCLPYDVFNAFKPETMHSSKISSLFSGLKVVRLLRIGRVTRKMDQYLEYMAASLVLMIFGFVLLAHWLACLWYTIGYSDLSGGLTYGWIYRLLNDTGNGKIDNDNVEEITKRLGKKMLYITSLYYTLSLITSIGFGNVSANTFNEKSISVLFMIIGAFGYATIFGKVTTIFQGMYATRSRYHDMMASVKDFVKTHTVPKDLAERVIDYVTSTWAITKGIDTSKVLNYCPKDMKADLCIHLNRMVFQEHSAFRLASDGCLRSLAVNFHTIHTAPGDLIFHQGESIDQLCFVTSGSLEVIQDDEIVAILGRGDVFGEAFWKDPDRMSHSSATIKALTYCDLHCIKKDRVLQVLQFYSAFANSFARNLVLTYDLKSRLIFRKLSDVKREQELAEHRKNEIILSELTMDHPVRRMINKFRRIGANQNRSVLSFTQETIGNNSNNINKISNSPNNNNNNNNNNSVSFDQTNLASDISSDCQFDNNNISLTPDKDPLRITYGSYSIGRVPSDSSKLLNRRSVIRKSSQVFMQPLDEMNTVHSESNAEVITTLNSLKEKLLDDAEMVSKKLKNIEDKLESLTNRFYGNSINQERYLERICSKKAKQAKAIQGQEIASQQKTPNVIISRLLQVQRKKTDTLLSRRRSHRSQEETGKQSSVLSNIDSLPSYSCQGETSIDYASDVYNSSRNDDILSSNHSRDCSTSLNEDDHPMSLSSTISKILESKHVKEEDDENNTDSNSK